MKVADILRVKGNTLYTVQPDEPLAKATEIMAEKDIGSLVVMEYGDLVGMLTFREVLACIVSNGGEIGRTLVRKAMDDHPMTCTPDTEIDEVRRMMLERQRGKDKLLLYFTDGAMPCENGAEERRILRNECAILKAKGIHTVGVGIDCDDPRKYGLDTIEVESLQDLPALLQGIGMRLTK